MSEPITIIGSETIVSGNLEGDEDLTIEGRVEGSISLSKTLTVEVGGVVRADINVRNAVISGVLVGNVEAQESVHITEQGRVVGDISAPRVILVDGSSFKGNIDMGDFNIDQDTSERRETKSRKPATPSVRVRPVVKEEVEEAVEEESEEPAAEEQVDEDTSVTRVRRAIPVRTTGASPKAPPVRPVMVAKGEKKQPPAPRVRAIGKKTKAKKKKG
ncbi:MAG: polymer-forming cytoskeletal protein [Deltaproteobacteria bacterium]|nr:polymer-forming cytoskeletal protein [Deltaproteobacteria bacterium]